MVKVSGAAGMELVLEEEGSNESDEPLAHLFFPTPNLLVGVTLAGAVIVWDLTEARRYGHIAPPTGPTGEEELVTAAHCPAPSASDAQDVQSKERYVILGLESGRIRVAQVHPKCRASGYTVESRDLAAGAPEELLAPGVVEGGHLGAVTYIASAATSEDIALFGYQHGGIVLWDWVRRKRLAIRGLSPHSVGAGCERHGEVTSLAFYPGGGAFAAGFASGCYAVFPACNNSATPPMPRWVREVGDDGSCPREGPTIVRTAVSLVQWVGLRGGDRKAWGLVIAGGVEIEEGEDPDGVSLLVPRDLNAAGSSSAQTSESRARGRGKRKGRASSSLSIDRVPLETVVFVPFAIGQERLSHVHAVVVSGVDDSGGFSLTRTGSSNPGPNAAPGWNASPSSDNFDDDIPIDEIGGQNNEEKRVGASDHSTDTAPEEAIVVLGLVSWTEELRGLDGRISFRRASSVQACPIQTSPYVALLQLSPEKIGNHLSGFAPVTAIASTPLLSSSTILDFATGLDLVKEARGGGGPSSKLLRGGGLKWADGVPPRVRDEALCTSEMLIAGHSDGRVTFWECCGPTSRQDSVSISDGRILTHEIPSGASFLGTLSVSELAGVQGDDDGGIPVTALDAWIERDHVAEAERNACWVAVGLDSGEAVVFVTSSRMDADEKSGDGVSGKEVKSGGMTPLAARPVEVCEVQLSEKEIEGISKPSNRWKTFGCGQGDPEAVVLKSGDDTQNEDAELEAAIAEARAQARAIEESGELNERGIGPVLSGGARAEQSGHGEDTGDVQGGDSERGEEEREEKEEGNGQEDWKNLRQELSEAMAEERVWGTTTPGRSPSPPPCSSHPEVAIDNDASGHGRHDRRGPKDNSESGNRKASLVQLALRLHSHPVRCVALSFDTVGSALALVVADAEGVVSVTDVSTGSASLLPMRAPQVRPCLPSVAIGPLPGALRRGTAAQGGQMSQQLGASGALFVLLDGWLNVFDLASRDPIDVAQVPGFSRDDGDHDSAPARYPAGAKQDVAERTWLFCINERGVPLVPYASEPLGLFDPIPKHTGVGTVESKGNVHERNSGRGRAMARTIWVTPATSRTALDSHLEHELQVMSDAPTPQSFLLAVRRSVAVVVATEEDHGVLGLSFSRRSAADGTDVALFKGRSGAKMVVKARLELAAEKGRARLPRVDGSGLCILPAGERVGGNAGNRGCLVATDTSGLVTASLLPSLSPVFQDRFPIPSSGGCFQSSSVARMSQKSLCNLVGELTVQGAAGVSREDGSSHSHSYIGCLDRG